MESAPQICSTAALNSLSGRTFAGTSSSTEKSRGDSRRKRTCVSPGLRLKSSSKRLRAVQLAVAAQPDADGDHARQVDRAHYPAATMSCTEIFGGAPSSGSTSAAHQHRRVFDDLRREALVVAW